MPDRRRHRGAHPEDTVRFAPEQLAALRAAVRELSWLSSRGYATPSSIALVGNRHGLDARQRKAVERCACADAALRARRQRRVPAPELAGRTLWIDGFNVLTTVEAALGGGALLLGRDGSLRDMASVHGSYRKVDETCGAVAAVGDWLAAHRVGSTRWLLDRPVSNSGRLRTILLERARSGAWSWAVDVVADPDRELIDARVAGRADGDSPVVVASADSAVLDGCGPWFPLARAVVESAVPHAWLLDLDASEPHPP